MGYDETIHERLAAGFHSDTREGKVQQFFARYDHWNPEVSDGSDLQEMEHQLGITPEEWAEYRGQFAIQF
jgi:hypothetical protein